MRLPLLYLILSVSTLPAAAATLTVGGPGEPNNGDCAPFGCAVAYQQVYGSGLFPGPVSITALTFFNHNFVPGSLAAANYSVFLSTTTAAVNGLSATFANNLGPDHALFFSGPLGGLIGPANQFTLSGTPFAYQPAAGNLLLTVTSDGDGQEFSVFLDFLSQAPAGTFSRAISPGGGAGTILESDTGLVTQFTYTPLSSAVPEPASFWLLAPALAFLMARRSQKA